ncbi:hypothetical protein [Cylindrospermum sp. FACHB-282]|uniref:hypothetical protein n=1 Tax=Cylindrospermum sp. FACHB-282 TaxID=2692794 RepID=UPI00168422D9|nr:hypothetical protein [Cylindrospermum sp. FACHB-282]MBD2387234.1 hypothetical protein [Cylindrospermum sp. FACHB-282]
MVPLVGESSSITRLAWRLDILQYYLQEQIILRMVSDYNLALNITEAVLDKNTHEPEYFDL